MVQIHHGPAAVIGDKGCTNATAERFPLEGNQPWEGAARERTMSQKTFLPGAFTESSWKEKSESV